MKTPWRITSGKSQEVRELHKLLRCEFAKLRRKPLFFAAAAVSALIPLGCALFLPDFQEFTNGAQAVDGMMSTLFQMSAYLLLMPALVVLASNLFFEEQDNDSLKNLLTVPVSKPSLAVAKMTLLFLFSITFMAVGGLVILAIVTAAGWEPVGFWRLFFVGIGEGIMMWTGALPCVLLVVLLNRSYIVSVIITFFLYGRQLYFLARATISSCSRSVSILGHCSPDRWPSAGSFRILICQTQVSK